ncbi:GtrA family protein [Polynucleobacter paneuropaeus]|nr:GtrA family protein [Polynucleobacter paneuropaeus]
MLNQEKIRYLLVGVCNSLAGYSIGVGLYEALSNSLSIVWIGIISNILSITLSFLSYKTLVFRTKGMWIREYIKSYIVYGGIAVIGIFFLWFFVDNMKISIWSAQALVMALTVSASYMGHARFTFRRRKIK